MKGSLLTQSTGLTTSRTTQETIKLGGEIATSLERGDVICLEGDLGAGKTTLAKGIISKLAAVSVDNVPSPTFNYLNLYESDLGLICHFDLYRLTHADQFLAAGFDEYFGDAICLIEWSDRIAELLPPSARMIELTHTPEGREITT